MKIRIVFGCLSIFFWVLLYAWLVVGSELYSRGKISVWNGEVIEEPMTYAEFIQKKTGYTIRTQMFDIAIFAGGFQFLAMRKGKNKRDAEQ